MPHTSHCDVWSNEFTVEVVLEHGLLQLAFDNKSAAPKCISHYLPCRDHTSQTVEARHVATIQADLCMD